MTNDGTKFEINQNIEELEKLADKVLSLKHDSIPRRPIVIEFCGSPKSGKSSSINSLNLFLKRNKFRTKVLTERASVCPITKKYDPYFNIWTSCTAISALAEILSNNPKDYDVIILDRGIFDAICWFSWLLKTNHLDNDNYNSMISFLTMKKWRAVIDLIYVFSASPKVSMEREYSNLLTRKMGSIMHPDILKSNNETINEVIMNYSSLFKKVQHFDTSEKGINEVNYEVTKNILEILEVETAEKVGYFDLSCINQDLPMSFQQEELINNKVEMKFSPRPEVEADEQKLQPIPVVVITNTKRDKIFVVKKNKNQTSSNSPESNKTLLYLGGHTRAEDSMQSSPDDTLSILRYCLQRELKEETGIDFHPEDNSHICIWSKATQRSKQHVALCYILEVDFDRVKITLDKNEFVTTGSTKNSRIQPVSDLEEIYHELEDWSKTILTEIFQVVPSSKQPSLFDMK